MKTVISKLAAYLGILALIIGVAWAIGDFVQNGPRLVRPTFQWSLLGKDRWIYAPVDVNPWVPDFKDPVGVLEKTDAGVWRAEWRWKVCGEYLTRELAERCIENSADDDGLFGYQIKVPKPAPEAKP